MTKKKRLPSYRITAIDVVKTQIKIARVRGIIPEVGQLDEAQFKALFQMCQNAYPFKDLPYHEFYSLWCEERDAILLPLKKPEANNNAAIGYTQLGLF